MEKPQSWRRSADSLEEIARLMSSGKERDIVLQMARSRRRRAAELEAKQSAEDDGRAAAKRPSSGS